jgi:iron complex outermembrane receptor protein
MERWVQGGVYNSTYVQGIDINNNHVVGKFYTNMTLEYAATGNLNVYARVDNLFNVSPPIVPNSLTEPYTASSPFYDVLGTTWAIGFRFTL